jgi:hypothetical protein
LEATATTECSDCQAASLCESRSLQATPWGFCKLRDDGTVPVICPTCQMSWRGKASMPAAACYFAWGCFRCFGWKRESRRLCGCLPVDDRRMARLAVARVPSGPPSPLASAWQPSLASRAKAGGPGRTRTCNQTVMSALGQQNALVFSGFFTSTICDLLRSFTFMGDPTGTPTGPEEQGRTADSVI